MDQLSEIKLIRTRGRSFASVVTWEAMSDLGTADGHYKPTNGRIMFNSGDDESIIQMAVTNDPTGKPISFQLYLTSVSGRDTLGKMETKIEDINLYTVFGNSQVLL